MEITVSRVLSGFSRYSRIKNGPFSNDLINQDYTESSISICSYGKVVGSFFYIKNNTQHLVFISPRFHGYNKISKIAMSNFHVTDSI